jgi:uncharacterized protein YlxW (UPF0749 family)
MRRDVQLSLTLVFFILSGLVATQLKTQQKIRDDQKQVSQEVTVELNQAKREAAKLRAERDALRAKVSQHEKASEQDTAKVKLLSADLQKMKLAVGMTAVKGPGVMVLMRDNPPKNTKDLGVEATELYLVHDYQVLQVVNELRSAGAEAVAVNGHRLGANSYVRCVGPVITIDGTRIGGPYKIEAIGNPAALKSGLELPGGIVEQFNSIIAIKVAPQKELILPAVDGALSFKTATPVETPAHTADEQTEQ